MIFLVIITFTSDNSDLTFTHQFYRKGHHHNKFYQNHYPQYFRNLQYHHNRIPSGTGFSWVVLHHSLVSINIDTTVV